MTPSPSRRVIPLGYKVCKLSLHGESPLLMSSGEADRDSDTYIAYRQLSKQRTKSVEDEDRLRELEWHTRLDFDEELGPYIPGKNVKELLREAATKWRKGEDVKRSLVVPDYRIPLTYDGPRTVKELWAGGFRYTAMVANAGAGSGRVTRTRPCFDHWDLDARSPSTRSTLTCRCSSPSSNGPRSTVSVITVPSSERSALISNCYASGARMRTRMPSSRAIAKPRRRTRRMWKGSSQQLQARLGSARPGKARPGNARLGMSWPGTVWHGMAWRGGAGHGRARHGRGEAWLGMAFANRPGKTRVEPGAPGFTNAYRPPGAPRSRLVRWPMVRETTCTFFGAAMRLSMKFASSPDLPCQ